MQGWTIMPRPLWFKEWQALELEHGRARSVFGTAFVGCGDTANGPARLTRKIHKTVFWC